MEWVQLAAGWWLIQAAIMSFSHPKMAAFIPPFGMGQSQITMRRLV
jgi:hypothetical protein